MTHFEKLKKIYPNLDYIKYDGDQIQLVFDCGTTMTRQEFISGSDTYKIMLAIDELLYLA